MRSKPKKKLFLKFGDQNYQSFGQGRIQILDQSSGTKNILNPKKKNLKELCVGKVIWNLKITLYFIKD